MVNINKSTFTNKIHLFCSFNNPFQIEMLFRELLETTSNGERIDNPWHTMVLYIIFAILFFIRCYS